MSEAPYAEFDLFDIHQHVGSTADAHGIEITGHVAGARLDADEVTTRIRMMDEGGIRQAVVSPAYSYDRSDGIAATRRENDAIAEYRDANPDRFPLGAGVVEPRDQASGLAEIDRMSNELGFVGVSLHLQYQGVTIDNKWMLRYLERMGELGMVPIIHAPDDVLHEALWRLAKVARQMPDLTILTLEPFFTLESMLNCTFVADIAPNLLFDTAACYDTNRLEGIVRQIGAERFLYGSQWSSVSQPSGFARHKVRKSEALRADIAGFDIPHADRVAIFGGNARRLFAKWL